MSGPAPSQGSGGQPDKQDAVQILEFGMGRDPRRYGTWGMMNESKVKVMVQGTDELVAVYPDGLSLCIRLRFCDRAPSVRVGRFDLRTVPC